MDVGKEGKGASNSVGVETYRVDDRVGQGEMYEKATWIDVWQRDVSNSSEKVIRDAHLIIRYPISSLKDWSNAYHHPSD